MDVVFRVAKEEDCPAILKLICQEDMSPDTSLELAEVQCLFEQISKNSSHKLYVGVIGTEVIASFSLICIQQISHNAAKSAVLEDVVVASELQGKGIGTTLIEFAIERAKEMACYKLSLSSGVARENAHEFYRRRGFIQDGLRFAFSIEPRKSAA